MARTTHAAKRAVLTFLESTGEASPSMIAESLGEGWASKEKRELLQRMIGRMTRESLLIRVRRGVYRASPNHEMIGIDWHVRVEEKILKFLREAGGEARTKEIHEAVFGRRELGEVPRTFDHRLVSSVLRESRLFQSHGHGFWSLVAEVPTPRAL
jgi:hypothetical protein